MQITAPNFKANSRAALADATLQQALNHVRSNFIEKRRKAVDALPEFDLLRDAGRDIKNHTLAHLDLYLEAYEEKVREAGGAVHYAETAAEARDLVLAICSPESTV
jgi:L-lactate dehydrogenase complex protein LldF